MLTPQGEKAVIYPAVLLKCSPRPHERGTEWELKSLVQVC